MCIRGVVPIVLAHARALLSSRPEGRTAYIDASFFEPDTILASDGLRDTLDLTRPVALSLIALLHFIPDHLEPQGVVTKLLDALPSGSYLNLTNATAELAPDELGQAAQIYKAQGIDLCSRSLAETSALFDGLELVDPGVTLVHRWHPDPAVDGDEKYTDSQVSVYGGLARKH